jgi:hypothetical protein
MALFLFDWIMNEIGRRAASAAAARLIPGLIEIEDLTQPAFAFARVAVVFAVVFAVTVIIIVIVVALTRLVRGRHPAFDELVEFASIQPDAATLRAVINFHALPVGDAQFNITSRTIHFPSLNSQF